MRKSLFAIGLAVGLVAAPAHADWHRAESDHFVIYADEKPETLRAFGDALERYHSAMAKLTNSVVVKPSPSNRVTIYVTGSEDRLSKLARDKTGMVAGFYRPSATGSLAFVPDIKRPNGALPFSSIVLLHEYAHHFLISTSAYAMPRWLSEGSAEFFASAQFAKDGTVSIGRPADHRAGELAYAQDVTVAELVDPVLYEKKHGRAFDAFYVRAWALYHYLVFEPSRANQLAQYSTAITKGRDSKTAAVEIFGDLKALDREVDRYLSRPSMTAFTLKPEMTSPGTSITVAALSPGMGEVMPLMMVSKNGVDREAALALVGPVRKVAARYPEDPGVLAALAEAEYDAGNDDAAIAAADRALAANPAEKNALVQKGYALFRKARDADDPASLVKAALAPFVALNKLENDHPLPLIYLYRSYELRGTAPSENARHGLERASSLAPFDKGLAYETGMMMASEGKIKLARLWLRPVAADPHGGKQAARTQALIDLMTDLPDGTKPDMAKLLRDADLRITAAEPVTIPTK